MKKILETLKPHCRKDLFPFYKRFLGLFVFLPVPSCVCAELCPTGIRAMLLGLYQSKTSPMCHSNAKVYTYVPIEQCLPDYMSVNSLFLKCLTLTESTDISSKPRNVFAKFLPCSRSHWVHVGTAWAAR